MPAINLNNNDTNNVQTNKVAIAHGYSFQGDSIIPKEVLQQDYQGILSYSSVAPVLAGTFIKWEGGHASDGGHSIVMPVNTVTDKIAGYILPDLISLESINQDYRKGYVAGEPIAIGTKSAFIAWYSSVNNLVIGQDLFIDITNVDLWKRGWVTNVALNNTPLNTQCMNKSGSYYTKDVKFNTTTRNFDVNAAPISLNYAIFNINTF